MTALARSVLDMAQKVTPFIPGTMDDAAVAAAKAVVNVIDRFREISNASADELAAAREDVELRALNGLRDEASALRG